MDDDDPIYDPSGRASDFDEGSADIPLWGWLTGATARRDAARAEAERARQERLWAGLAEDAPTADDLTPEYALEGREDEYGDLFGGPSQFEGAGALDEQQYAMDALRQLHEGGGYTDADMAAQRAARAAQAQQVGSMNRAALAQMEARGGGGGGASLAAQLAGGQALANATVQSDAAFQQSAMQRALQALQGYQAGGNVLAQQDMQRRAALDAFNQQQTDWRRGRQSRNTGWQNQQQDADVRGRQQAWDNQANALAGRTGQWAGADAGRRADQQRQDEASAQGANVLGTIISGIL